MLFRVALALTSFLAWGQTGTGELRLTVKDPAGLGVPASVDLRNEATKTRQNVTLPADGRASLKNLPYGFYSLTVQHAGFAPRSLRVEIRSAVPQNRDITLDVETVHTAVVVAESATMIDPNRTGSAYYVGSQEVKERPSGLPGRGLIELAVMQPGWLLEANGVLHPRESEYDTQYIVNGFPVQDNRSPAFAPSVDADTVESMKMYTSGIPAEYGQKLGGVIEINTNRNTSPGFHGIAVAQGGSFSTAGGFLSLQYVAGRTTSTITAEGFLTDHYLDPPVIANYTNHGSSASFTGTVERDFNDRDRLRVSVAHRQLGFLVPDNLLQQAAGQRQDRTSADTEGQVSYQHVFSAAMVGSVRAMVRDVGAELWSNPLSTPISAHQDRGYREGYLSASLAGHSGRHEWKIGTDARFASIREEFGYQILSYDLNGTPVFDPGLPATFEFRGRSPDREQSAYAEDLIRLGNFTVSAGLRFDHYRLLVDETGWSPRFGVSWHYSPVGLVLHASYDRTFGTPPFENILMSASAGAMLGTGFYLPIHPSRGNYYEGGFTQGIGKRVRLDASYFLRDFRNALDDDLLLNTGVSFPITFQEARIRGVEAKLEMPRWGRFSGYLSYANTIGTGEFPISGGLFLDDSAAALLHSTDKFPVTQDQRNAARAWARYQIAPRLWTAWTASYTSGLPVEGDLPDTSLLISQYGPEIVSKVNFSRGRVNPSFSVNASVGADLWKHEKRSVSVQGDVTNLTNRLNVINFAGLLSGTAIAPPRGFGIRLRVEF